MMTQCELGQSLLTPTRVKLYTVTKKKKKKTSHESEKTHIVIHLSTVH